MLQLRAAEKCRQSCFHELARHPMTGVFDPAFEDLPVELPIFPLTGVLLLPGGRLPLNIFEPRYLNMASSALAGDRMVGMIQPTGDNEGAQPAVYRTGCAGRLTSFTETEDGRYLVTLSGYVRFDIDRELPLRDGFRTIVPDWTPYREDLAENDSRSIDRDRMLRALRGYFTANQVDANWEAIKDTPTDSCERTGNDVPVPAERKTGPARSGDALNAPILWSRCWKCPSRRTMTASLHKN